MRRVVGVKVLLVADGLLGALRRGVPRRTCGSVGLWSPSGGVTVSYSTVGRHVVPAVVYSFVYKTFLPIIGRPSSGDVYSDCTTHR